MTDVTRDERAELHAALGRIEALLIEIAGRQPAPRLTIAELAPAGTSARTAARRGHLAASAPGESLTEGARAPRASCYGSRVLRCPPGPRRRHGGNHTSVQSPAWHPLGPHPI